MTQEDKDILFRDLCARLPYGVMISVQGGGFDSYKYPCQLTAVSKFGFDIFCRVYNPIYTPFGVPNVEDIKPYLRPMSSMTEEERMKIASMAGFGNLTRSAQIIECCTPIIDYCYSRHLDIHNLIKIDLALKAPEGMYKTE